MIICGFNIYNDRIASNGKFMILYLFLCICQTQMLLELSVKPSHTALTYTARCYWWPDNFP